jgi:hypothetical protein
MINDNKDAVKQKEGRITENITHVHQLDLRPNQLQDHSIQKM